MPRASRTATQAEKTEQAVNSAEETEKQQETANTNATEGRFIYIGPTTNTGLVENTIFTGSRAEIEEYLKEYIGNTYEILETCEKIYIGNDFPDEFCHSKDKIRLKGANEKAKAKKGWYRYDTRFGIPKYDENGELEGYHIYSAKMLVRRDEDGKLYLYDFVRTKKETSSPLES